MPQLDKVTFCTQVFWLVVVFISLYIVVVRNFIPRLAYILKFRAKLEKLRGRSLARLNEELEESSRIQKEGITRYINEVRALSTNLSKEVDTWYAESFKRINKYVIKDIDKLAITQHANQLAYNYAIKALLRKNPTTITKSKPVTSKPVASKPVAPKPVGTKKV